MKPKMFDHLAEFELKSPHSRECSECVESNSRRVHLRICRPRGVALCGDSSLDKHASALARLHNHPVAVSAEPGEKCEWRYTGQMAIADTYHQSSANF